MYSVHSMRRAGVPFDRCRPPVGYCDEWTLNASLTTSSSYRKCSKRRILGHSAQTTSLLRMEGMTKCSRIARAFGFGTISASATELSLRYSDCLKSRPKLSQEFRTRIGET